MERDTTFIEPKASNVNNKIHTCYFLSPFILTLTVKDYIKKGVQKSTNLRDPCFYGK